MTINKALYWIRSRFQPFDQLRRTPGFHVIERIGDRPVWVQLKELPHKVRIRAVRDASYLLTPATPEPEILALIVAICRTVTVDSFWDVGSKIGYYGWLVKAMCPTASIVLFEPDPANLAMISETLRRASLEAVEVVPYAVSDRQSTSELWLDRTGFKNSLLPIPKARAITVDTLSLDVARQQFGPPTLVKIDVEGVEGRVVAGAAKVLGRDRPILVVECLQDRESIIKRLTDVGYSLFNAADLTESVDIAPMIFALPPQWSGAVGQIRTTTAQVRRRLGVA